MINLANTTDRIQVILGSAVTSNQLNCFSVYRDTTSTSISPISNLLTTNNTTAVDLVGSPSASTQRLVEYISVYNSDTNGAEVTIRFSDNGTYYTLYKCILEVGDKIEYSDKLGFRTITNIGSIRNSTNYQASRIANSGFSTLALSDSVTIQSYAATPQTAYGFGFPTKAGKYYHFRYLLFFDVDATTTGSRFNVNFPQWSTYLSLQIWQSLTTTGFTVNNAISLPTTPTTANATSAATTGNEVFIEGIVFAESNDFISISFASEVASPAYVTLKAGSFLNYNEVY